MGEITPPLYMDVATVYSGDELGLPYRDLLSEGVVGGLHLKVSQRAAGGANMSVDIAAGAIWILGDSNPAQQPCYRCRNDSIVNLAISAAHGTNPRIDRVVAECIDQAFAGSGRLWRLRVITGTPTSGATLVNLNGEAAQPDTAVTLAHVLVPAASSSVTDPNIADVRPRARVGAGEALGGYEVGEGKLWFTDTPPELWIILDGVAKSRTVYAELFALWGTTFGAGDGSTTFGIPDYRGRMPVGKGTHVDVDALTDNDALAVGSRRPKHKTSVTDPTHAHLQQGDRIFAAGSNVASGAVYGVTSSQVNTAAAATGITAGPQTGSEPTDTVAYQVCNFIVYAGA